MFELEQVFKDDSEAAAQFTSHRTAQAVDLLGKVLPIERQFRVEAGRLPQHAGLLFGPADKILFVEPRCVAGHWLSS